MSPVDVIKNKCTEIKKKLILNFLKANLDVSSLWHEIEMSDSCKQDKYCKCIWVCWFQGIDQAPDLVKKCIDTLTINAPSDYTIIIIDEKNIADYISLPIHILSKYESGIISKAQLSDILRFNLLATYGGIWVDSTIFCMKNLSFLTSMDFFTLKSENYDKGNSLSRGLWTGYFLKCPQDYKPFIFIKYCFNKYWSKNEKLIDYFLVDYLMLIAYEYCATFRDDINKLDFYGNDRFLFEQLLSQPITDANDILMRKDNIGIYKLTIKKQFPQYFKGNQLTYFGKYFQENKNRNKSL